MTSITTCETSSRVVEAGGAVHTTGAAAVRDAVARVGVQASGTAKTCAPLACTPSPSPPSADLLDEHAWLLPLLRACVDADDDDDDDGARSNSINNNNNNNSCSGADVGGITRSNSDCIDGSGNSNNTSATLSLLPMPMSVPATLPHLPPPSQQQQQQQQQQQSVVGCVNNRVAGNDSQRNTRTAAAVTACAPAAAGPTTANNARAPANPMQYRNVYISGLPTYFRSEDLRAMCQPYGRIEALKLCVTQKSHPSKTYCFVLFRTEAAAAACIAAKNGSYLAGHFLQARYADASATPQPVDTSKVAIIPPTPRPAILRSAVPAAAAAAAATSMLLMHAPPGCLVAPPLPPPSPLQAATTAAAAATTLGMSYATGGMPLYTPHLGLHSTTLLPPPPPPTPLALQHTAQVPLATAPATAAAPVVAATAPDAGMMPAPLLYYPAAMPFAACPGATAMPPTQTASVALQHMPMYAPPCVVQPPQPQSLTHMYTPCPRQPPQHIPRRATYML